MEASSKEMCKKAEDVILQDHCVRPGADQSSKATFGKSTFAKTCSNVLSFVKDMTGAHQWRKSKSTFEHVLAHATSKMLSAKMCSKAFLLFARLMCASRIFNKRKQVLAKVLLPKSSFVRLVCTRP